MLKVSVLVSGNGSNLQALIDQCPENASIDLVISDKPDCLALKRAEKAGIKTVIVPQKKMYERDAEIDRLLKEFDIELVCLAGYMRLLSEKLVTDWHNKIINIHPSLLPAFKGLNVQQRAIDAGVKFSGCTVHFVRPEMDSGPIINQAVVPVLPDDTAETLAARILEQEHICYPQALKAIANDEIMIVDERVIMRK